MAVVFNDIGSSWDLKKLFGEETEEEARAAEELAAAEERSAAARAAEERAAAAKAARVLLYIMKRAKRLLEAVCCFKHDRRNWGGCPSLFMYLKHIVYACVYGLHACLYQSSRVLHEGDPCLYSCLCYPKAELEKEDEEWYGLYGPRYVHVYEYVLALLPKMYILLPIKRIDNKVSLPKMFNDWAKKYSKRYHSVYEWRLRYKIWLSAKKVTEQSFSRTGQTFSIEKMNRSADQTLIERGWMHGYKPSKIPLSQVRRFLLKTMGRDWMTKVGKGFEEWAERHKRVYSTEEKEDRRLAYLENMSSIELEEKRYPGLWQYGKDLDNMDKFAWEADLIPPAPCSRCRPHK